MGEVAEHGKAGEGINRCKALSVTCGDSSPRGRAKSLQKWSVLIPVRSIRRFRLPVRISG